MHVYMRTHVYVYIYIYVCVYIYIYICTYTRTHTHAYTPDSSVIKARAISAAICEYLKMSHVLS